MTVGLKTYFLSCAQWSFWLKNLSWFFYPFFFKKKKKNIRGKHIYRERRIWGDRRLCKLNTNEKWRVFKRKRGNSKEHNLPPPHIPCKLDTSSTYATYIARGSEVNIILSTFYSMHTISKVSNVSHFLSKIWNQKDYQMNTTVQTSPRWTNR